ncbi:DUF4142 domain-containing protein [Chitinophaga lutea]
MKSISAMLVVLALAACNSNTSRQNADTLSAEDTGMTQEMAQDLNKDKYQSDSVRNATDDISKAAEDGLYEVKLMNDGQSRASSASIKSMAKHMQAAHEKLNKELMDLAAKKAITLPTALEDAKVKDINNIMEKSGTDFDKAFINETIDKHEKAIKLFEDIANNATDTDIKAFFTKALPELREHLAMAQKEKDKLK